MKGLYTTLCAIAVGIIAYLLARKYAQRSTTAGNNQPAVPAPVTTVAGTTVTSTPPAPVTVTPAPVAVPVTTRVIRPGDGKAYASTLPAPYNTMPVTDGFASGAARPEVTGYYLYKYKSTPMIWAMELIGMSDADVIAYLNSVKPVTTDHQFIIKPGGTIIKGNF